MIDGKPYPIPKPWAESSIGKVVVKTKQRDPRKKPDEVFQYVDVSSVSNESFKITGATPTLGTEAPSRARKAIETNDVLFATVRPTLKRVALVPPELYGAKSPVRRAPPLLRSGGSGRPGNPTLPLATDSTPNRNQHHGSPVRLTWIPLSVPPLKNAPERKTDDALHEADKPG